MSPQINQPEQTVWKDLAFRAHPSGTRTPLPWLRYVLFYALMANIPFWYARWAGGLLPLGWFCVEYLLVGIAGLWLPGVLTAALLLLVTCADVVSAISGTFFLTPMECVRFSASLTDLAMTRVLLLSVALVLIGVNLLLAAWLSERRLTYPGRRRAALGLCIMAAVIGTVDLMAAREDATARVTASASRPALQKQRFRHYDSLWLGRYTAARLWREQRNSNAAPAVNEATVMPASSMGHATSFAVGAAGIDAAMPLDARPNLVVVLVESWGIENNIAVREALTESFHKPDLLQKYQVREGTVPFHGGTIGGEMRELCGSSLGLHVLDMSRQQLSQCLPTTLSSLGYHLTTVHGMSGSMYDRVHWWPRIGFQDVWFRERLLTAKLPLCAGPYIGICDDAVAEWMTPRLQTTEHAPQFLYWVTLNSHLPVAPHIDIAGATACSIDSDLQTYPELCSWSKLVWRVHHAVAHMAMQPLSRPTVFLLVGDHAPPFGQGDIREQFSSTEVPYLLLVPRSSPVAPSDPREEHTRSVRRP